VILRIPLTLVKLQGNDHLNRADYNSSVWYTEYGRSFGYVFPHFQLLHPGLLPHVPGAAILLEKEFVSDSNLAWLLFGWDTSCKFINSWRYSFSKVSKCCLPVFLSFGVPSWDFFPIVALFQRVSRSVFRHRVNCLMSKRPRCPELWASNSEAFDVDESGCQLFVRGL